MANVNAEMDNKLGEIQVLMAAMGFQTDLATGGRGDAAGAATGGDAAGAAGGDAAGAAGGDAAGATGGDAAGTPSTNGGGAAGADGMQNKDVTPAAKQVPADGKSQFVNPNGKKKPGQ